MRELVHARTTLALHELQSGEGASLLCLHALGGRGDDWRAAVAGWRGPVFALDFSGHGESGWLRGGGYSAELFAADADVALAELGGAHVVGAGLGAYVALLLAGSRPDAVPVAGLLPGRGLDAVAEPDWSRRTDRAPLDAMLASSDDTEAPTDPLVQLCENDLRPLDYVGAFVERAQRLVLADLTEPAPPWWTAVCEAPNGQVAGNPAAVLEAIAPNA